MPSFKMTVAPVSEPVTLSEAKAQARIDGSADDTLITSLITGARQWAEQYTNRALITQTWQFWLDACPETDEGIFGSSAFINLPRPPLISVSNVTSYDDSDTGTVWPSSNYYVDTIREPGRLALRQGAVWPTPTRLTNGIRIEYTAGYGASASAVPEPVKTAIRQLVAHWYEHRGEAALSGDRFGSHAMHVPLIIQALLDPYRIRYTGV